MISAMIEMRGGIGGMISRGRVCASVERMFLCSPLPEHKKH